MSRPLSGSQWQRVRRQVLERDGYRCKISGPHCKGRATEVDHIVPRNDGGSLYDMSNLRAACNWCNTWRAQQQKSRDGWKRSRTHIILVLGADASQYASSHAGPEDLVLDFSRLAETLGDAAPTAYKPVMTSIRRGEVVAGRAFIVSHNPDAKNIFPYHEVVMAGEALLNEVSVNARVW